MKKILVVLAPLALSACGGPIELTVAKLAGDLISYVTTGKSTTDHAVSFVAEQDCALHRPFMDEDICKDEDTILAEEPAALADLGAPEIKKEIRAARPEIYAVNAPAENWSRPENGAAKVIVKTDLPPRAPVAEAKPVEVAAATEQFNADEIGVYGAEISSVPDPQGEADAAIAGYVPDDKIAPKKQPETVTAALVDTTVMTDDVDQFVTPIDVKADGDGLAGDVLSTPLPGDYVVLASFSNQVRAQKALALYEEYQPRLLDAKVAGQAYLRVAVGPLSAQHAHDLRLLAAKKGIKDPWIVGVAATGE
ncbi:SPOR domain-containing protein [Thalassospira lucentensis]|uniref:SPOR domain-containing protein n=1 Tax=Thalassospira lucentensis TaxID=168935 RepID=UPI003D2EDDBF